MKHRVFYSFHYKPDAWRTQQVRKIGTIDGSQPVTANAWEEVKKGGNTAIKNWISQQIKRISCTVVLVGADTASREWVNYEIVKSWNDKKGVVGICIHGLKDDRQETSEAGDNPFDYVTYSNKKLSSIVRLYNPAGRTSKEQYDWIKQYLVDAIEEAIEIRNKN